MNDYYFSTFIHLSRLFFGLAASLLFFSASGQTPDTLVPTKWTANWIMHPTAPTHEHAVILFRKNLELSAKPDQFRVHVSADNHYRLFVNGKPVGKGPARGDLSHWFYETYDLAPYLQTGRNVLAAEVVNFGPKRTFSIYSQMTSFWMQGHGEPERGVDTKADHWKTFHNQAVQGRVVDWIYNRNDIAFGLYVGNPTDSVAAEGYPWGWQQPDFDDTEWLPAAHGDGAGTRGSQFAGGIQYSGGKLLIPRRTPLLQETPEPIGKVVRTDAKSPFTPNAALGKDVQLPANTRVKVLIDRGNISVGYPELVVSGGKGSRIQATAHELEIFLI